MTPHTEAACGLDERLAAYTTRRAARTSIVDCARLHLTARQPPWQSTGLRVRAGQSYSVFAAGRVYWAASAPDLYGGPRFHLWLRVNPGGRIRNLRADTDTFVADVDGELEIGLYDERVCCKGGSRVISVQRPADAAVFRRPVTV